MEYLIENEPSRFTTEQLDALLMTCSNWQASDITLQSGQPVFAEIQGTLYPITRRKLTTSEVGDLLNTIYGSNGTTRIYSGNDVDTHYELRPDRNQRFRFRVNGTGCQVEGHDALQITIRTIPTDPPALESLNLEPELIEAIAPSQGMVIVTGTTGSGKSTLLASIVAHLASLPQSNRKILTYEAPIEFVYDSIITPNAIISQSEIPRHLPSFADGIRNALRRKPRLILVGEARDEETINAAIEASLTGHPLYTTLHSNGVSDAVRRMISTFNPTERNSKAFDILDTTRLIIWQQLVKGTDGKQIALREFLVFDDAIRDKLLSSNIDIIAKTTKDLLYQYGQPMIVDAERKFKAGLIDEQTYNHISAGVRAKEKDQN